MFSISGLNNEQRKAADTIEGPVLILAGAGSGKTRSITYRMANMVENYGLDPKTILAVTFTNKAAREMKERVTGLLGKKKSKGITLSTFHSLALKILRAEIEKLGYSKNFTIFDTADQMSLIREALNSYQGEKSFDRKSILAQIGKLKSAGISSEEFSRTDNFNTDLDYDLATEHCYQFYTDKMKFYNVIDFDDIILLTVKLFKLYPEIAEKYSRRYQYIMVDEYQDTNQLQFSMILGLTSTHNNLCVVGDDDQSIYSFRGADITNILNFEKHFSGCTVIKLEENYRSTEPILNLANNVIKENKRRKEKSLRTSNTEGISPVLWKCADTDHEAQTIVEEITKFQSSGGHLSNMAVLVRSTTQFPALEDQLRISMVPYVLVGGQKFYERKEIKDVLAYLSIMHNPKDEIALRRILNVPSRGIGAKTLEKYLDLAKEKNIHLYNAFKDCPGLDPKKEKCISAFVDLIEEFKQKIASAPLEHGIKDLIERLNFHTYIDGFYKQKKQANRRKEDLARLVESAERFTKFFGESAKLRNFVEKMILQDTPDKDESSASDDNIRKNEVTLMTLHSSKGLEYDHVFLVGMEEELLPHKKSITQGDDIEEERRLAYVGLTRAKLRMVMTYACERKIYGRDLKRFPSRFLATISNDLYQNIDKNSFSDLS